MGDARLDQDMGSESRTDEFTILVTGFGVRLSSPPFPSGLIAVIIPPRLVLRNPATEAGNRARAPPKDKPSLAPTVPFRAQYPVNPSWEIARGLPDYLPPLRAKDPSARSDSDLPPVRILVHPEAIRVTYQNVRALVPALWDGDARRIDACVHIGMASARPQYALERLAHRTGYLKPDVAGDFLEDELPGGREDGCWIWHGLPDELSSALDIPNVYSRWKELSSPELDLKISDDPGRYLCDFIYYSSLATLYKQQRPGKVCFFHVPADDSDVAVERGRELAINLIRSIAESEIAEKKRTTK